MQTHRDPSRIEGFSDAVFGFSPTLAAFALMCWIWAEHNAFFRQFGLQDATTIVLNAALLFLVVFYTYPLKFMAVYLWMLVAGMFGWDGIMSLFDARVGQRVHLISIGIGVAAVLVMLGLPRHMAGLSGMVYMLMGPAHGFHGSHYGRARARLLSAHASETPPAADPASPDDGS